MLKLYIAMQSRLIMSREIVKAGSLCLGSDYDSLTLLPVQRRTHLESLFCWSGQWRQRHSGFSVVSALAAWWLPLRASA